MFLLCIDISGVPGIGKTASFLEVVNKLKNDRGNDFKFINVNAMKLSNPESLYNLLVKEIVGINASSKNQACLILSKIAFKMIENFLIHSFVLMMWFVFLDELFTRGKLPKKY